MKKITYSLSILLLTISIVFSITIAQGIDYENIVHNWNATKLEYVPWEIIVKYKESDIKLTNSSDKSIINQKANIYNLQVNKTIDRLNIAILKTNENQNINEIINILKQDDDIEFAEPNYFRYIGSIPTNDTHRNNLRALHNYWQNVNSTVWINDEDVDRLEAMSIFSWSNNESTTGTIVAVIDNGVAYTHPDISNKMRIGTSCKNHNGIFIGWCIWWYDYYNNTKNPAPTLNSHWTHIAWTIAAEMNNNKWIIWVNPNAKIMALKVWEDQSLSVSNTISAINFAIQNWVKIINASYGSNTYSASEYNAILAFKNAWWLFITAAWNDTNNNDSSPRYPCNYNLDNIICVWATTQTWALASFSNYWATSVHISAPGTNIYSATLWNKTTFFSENFESITIPNIPASFSSYWSNRTTKNNWILYVEDGNVMSFWKSLFTNAWTTYEDWMDSHIYSNTINLSWAEVALFQFAVKCNTDSGTWDVLKLEFSSDWVSFATRTSITWWTTPSSYSTIWSSINNSYFTSNFKFRFHWKTDNNWQVWSWCWIDNINIITYYTWTHDAYWYMQWTSMATPHVVGLASLVWSFRPDLSYIWIKNAIINNWDYLTSLDWKTISSNRINAYNTLYDLDNFWPTTPILTFPLSWANLTWGNISFLWLSATDIWVGISGYYYQLSTWSNFISPITWINIFTTWTIMPLSNTGTYYWRVYAFDHKNNTWLYSDTWVFTITSIPSVDTTPPSTPILIYPTWWIVLDTWVVNFLWNTSIDTGAWMSWYYYELLSWATTISWIVYTTWYTLILWSWNYSWKVRAFDNSGNFSIFSNTWTFSIMFPIVRDTTPEPITFTPITNVELNTLYTSNIVTLTWINTWITIAISGWEYSINWGLRTTWINLWYQLNTLTVRRYSSTNYATTTWLTLYYWNLSTWFTITTKAFVADTTPDPVTFLPINNANLNTLYASNIVTLTWINTGIIISINTWMYRINWWAWQTTSSLWYQWNTIQLALTSSVSFATLKSMILTYWTLTTGFNVTTQAQDTMPDAFSFTSLTNQELNSYATGNTITISWINTGSQISITNGEYKINAWSWVSTTWIVYNWNTVTIRLLTPNTYLTSKIATLTIWWVSWTFAATTKPLIDTIPPSIPVLSFPIWGTWLTTGNINFRWLASTDTWVGMSWYYYQISTWSTMINILHSWYTSNTWVTFSLGSWSYYWRVKSIDLTWNQSAYSTTWTFTITLPIVWDSSPDIITFTPINNAELNTLYSSNTITIAGINTWISVSINTGQYRINWWSWILTTSIVNSWDTIQLRLTWSNTFSTTKSMTLTYWDKSSNFTVTTRYIDSIPNTFTFNDITNAELNTVYTSNVVTILWLETWYFFTAIITTGQLTKNNILVSWLNTGVQNGDSLSIILTSSPSYSTTINAILTIWSGSDTYSITTKTNPSWWWWGWGGWWVWGWWELPICLNSQLICLNWERNIQSWVLCQWGNLSKTCQIITGENNSWENNVQNLNGNITWSKYSMELNNAYLWAYANKITTMNTIDKADMEWSLIRSHTSKMMSNFALMLWLVPNTGLVCNFKDISKQSDEMKYYIKLSCQLWLMGQWMSKFDPNGLVTRAQFWTILSRVLWWEKYNISTPYYKKHLNALKESEIMKKIDTPNSKELRWRVMLMMMRVDEKIKQNEVNF